jgi:hypothetical protein
MKGCVLEGKTYNLNTHLTEFRSTIQALSEKSAQLRRYL